MEEQLKRYHEIKELLETIIEKIEEMKDAKEQNDNIIFCISQLNELQNEISQSN